MGVPTIDLAGSLVLVTGAGSGIGRATAFAFAGRGATVVSVDRDDASARRTAHQCGRLGLTGVAYVVDVSDREAVAELARTVEADHGPLDVLVNNAGVGMSARFLDTTAEDWDWILGVNVFGVINGCRAFGPAMVARGRGHVVNVSSGLAYMPRATEPAYVTTKAAVLALSRCLRADWGPLGVGVSAICPGVIATPIITRTRFRGDRAEGAGPADVERFFARRGHAPEAVARAIVGAVESDRAVIPVGVEAWLGWVLHRLLPLRAADRLARSSISGM